MRVLVWQWGRRGAGPLVAAAIARGLAEVPGVETRLSLSTGAELLRLPGAPVNDIPVRTYQDRIGFATRIIAYPWLVASVQAAVEASRADVALCAMPAPLDLAMASALRRAGVPYAVVVHDAERHPGDLFPMQITLQRWLLRRAGTLFALSTHVAEQLRQRGQRPGQQLLLASLPPFVFGPPPPPAGAHGGRLRLLSFGRLLPYKGLDLLGAALQRLGVRDDMEVRVVGSGPESAELALLRSLPNVTVENRWVPEAELGAVLGWADALVLSHREASQSGVAAAAIASRRWVVATQVGGLAEQLGDSDMAILCEPNPDSLASAIAGLCGRTVAAQGPAGQPVADRAEVPTVDWLATAKSMAAGLADLVTLERRTAPVARSMARPEPNSL